MERERSRVGDAIIRFKGSRDELRSVSELRNASRYLSESIRLNPGARGQALAVTIPLVDLNFRSTKREFHSPVIGSEISILNNGESMVVGSKTRLTASQAVAVRQVMDTGTQTITLGKRGNATGGVVNLSELGFQIDDLLVPKNLTVVSDHSQGDLVLRGDLVNAGVFEVTSSSGTDVTANVFATNIRNTQGAVITSSSLAGNSVADLNLLAADRFENSGTVFGYRNLSVTAGGVISNIEGQGATGQRPAISAVNNLTINSPTVVNHGVMIAENGDLNVAPLSVGVGALQKEQSLFIEASNGLFEAKNGDVNIGSESMRVADMVQINGGDYRSNNLNLEAGEGIVSAMLGEVTGTVRTHAGQAYVGANTSTLTLGQCLISGDPTFFSFGDLVLVGDIVVNEHLALLASGDVIGNDFDVRSTTGAAFFPGHPIVIVAGANLITTGSAQFPSIADSEVEVSGPSSTGGSILLGSGSLISSSSPSGAADIQLVAYAAISGAKGTISIGEVTAGGGVSNISGNITLIAGGNSDNSIVFSRLLTERGSVQINAAQPVGKVKFSASGVSKGEFEPSFLSLADISTGEINTQGGDVFITGGGLVTIAEAISTMQSLTSTYDAPDAGNVAITGANIFVADNINASGQHGRDAVGSRIDGGTGGGGGQISLTAIGGDITLPGTVTIQARGGDGGDGRNGTLPLSGSGRRGEDGGRGGDGGAAGGIRFESSTLFAEAPMNLIGGTAGFGGNGSDGASSDTGTGGAGGRGGESGSGGAGGIIFVKATGNVNVSTSTLDGGDGRNGANAGSGGAGASGSKPGSGGQGGKGGFGGSGGTLTVATDGDVLVGSFTAEGGLGASGGHGGSGSKGGKGGVTARGGDGGEVDINVEGSATLASVLLSGGFNPFGSNSGGSGQVTGPTEPSGPGGDGGSAGAGGRGGKVKVVATEVVSDLSAIEARGGGGGSGGNGGSSLVGGQGGNGGEGSRGGDGGSVTVKATATGQPIVSGATGGAGGAGGSGFIPGKPGVAGKDGKLGKVKISQ